MLPGPRVAAPMCWKWPRGRRTSNAGSGTHSLWPTRVLRPPRQNADVRTSCQSLGGWVALVSGDPAGAERRLDDALRATPAGAGGLARSWMAWLRVAQGRADEALAMARTAQGQGLGLEAYRFPNAYALMAASMAYATLGQADDAFRTIEALEADVERMGMARWVPRPLNLRGWITRNLGQPERADDLNQSALAAAQGQGMAEPLANALLDLAAGRLMDDDLDEVSRYLHRANELAKTEHAFRWRQQLRARLLQARCDLARGDTASASEQAASLARVAFDLGVPRYGVQAGLVHAVAEARAGRTVDRNEVDRLLHRLKDVAGLEAWWITADIARVFDEPKWDALARARVAELMARAGPHARSLEAAARRRLD